MSIDDRTDLEQVRALVSPRTTTSLEELSRLRYRVLRGEAPRTRRRAWAAPVTAALLALAVLAGIGVALNRGGGPQGPGLAPAPSGTMTFGPGIDPPTAFDDLERVAASTRPVTVGSNDQLHVRQTMMVPAGGPDHTLVPQVRDTWYEVRGMIPVRDLSDGKPAGPGPKGEDETALERQSFAESGPGPDHPTPEWLAGLSSDASVLQGQISGSTKDSLWSDCMLLLLKVDPLLPSGVRVALLRLLNRNGTVEAHEVTVGGRRLIGVGLPDRQSLTMLLFDLDTAHVAGWAQVSRGDSGVSPSAGVSAQPLAPGAVRIDDQRLYAYEIVRR